MADTREEISKKANQIQEDFSVDMRDLLKKYSVRDLIVMTSIPIPYDAHGEDCANDEPHQHELGAAVQMIKGDPKILLRAFMTFYKHSPEFKKVVQSAMVAESMGLDGSAESVSKPDSIKW